MGLLARSLYDDDHEAFRDSVRRFLAAEVVPRLDEWRSQGGTSREVYTGLGEQGFLGTSVPEEYGGGGVADPRFTAVLVEEIVATGAVGLALAVARHAGVCVPALLRLPEGDGRAGWLQTAAAGESLVVPMLLAGGGARAVPAGTQAGLFLALRDDQAGAVVVTRDQVAVEAASVLGGLDVGAADVVLHADPSECSELPGADLVLRDLDLWSSVLAVAGARASLDLALGYVRERKVFGRPIAEFENTRFRLAEVEAALAAASCLVDSCLSALEVGALDRAMAGAARMVAAQVHDRAVDLGVQLHGGYGYMREYAISTAFGDARFLRTAAAGTSEPRHVVATAAGL